MTMTTRSPEAAMEEFAATTSRWGRLTMIAGLILSLAGPAYLLLVGRGLRIGFAGQDDFGKLLASGLAFTIAFQVFIVVGGVTRVIPLTGLTAPFLAAGGSSLVSNWIIIALLLLLSNSVRNRPKLVIRA